MPTILLNKIDETYLQKCAAEQPCAYGIIIGQILESDKFIAVHLARNCEQDVDVLEPHDETDTPVQPTANVIDVDIQALATQWISACRMIPGSFDVLGIFVTNSGDNIFEEKTFVNAKKLLHEVHNMLINSNTLCNSIEPDQNRDYIFLTYSGASKKTVCKAYTQASNGGTLSSMDCRFVEKPFEWCAFECTYEMDDIFPIMDGVTKLNIEHEFHKALLTVKQSLLASQIFIQNECVEDALALDAYIKKKFSDRKKGYLPSSTNPLKASIFLPLRCELNDVNAGKVRKFNGTMRFTGIISTRVWCNSKTLFVDVKRYIRNDILRSLAARVQVYCDGLTEPKLEANDVFVSEPPRRVYFNLHGGKTTSPIQFSEYIFRGEAPTVAVAQAKQVLDMDLQAESIFTELEELPDDATFSEISIDQPDMALGGKGKPVTLTRTFYMLGIGVSLLVLLLSLLLHRYMQ